MIKEVNLSDFEFDQQFWVVGSSFNGTEDQTESFLANGHWIEGWGLDGNDKNKTTLDKIILDDVLIMKSSSNKGPKKSSIRFTRVKAIGVITKKVNFYTFLVNWLDTNSFPKDFAGINYSRTIEQLRNDELLKFVKKFPPLIPFIKK